MIEHEVDGDAAHGNVKPKRQCPANTTTDTTPITQRTAGDSAVTVLTTGKRISSTPIYLSSNPRIGAGKTTAAAPLT